MHIGDLLFISFSSSNVLFCFVCRNRTLNSLAPLFFYRIAFSSVTLYFCLFLCVCVLLLFRCMMLFTGKAIGITSKIFPFYSSRSVRFAFLTHFPIRKVKLAFFCVIPLPHRSCYYCHHFHSLFKPAILFANETHSIQTLQNTEYM